MFDKEENQHKNPLNAFTIMATTNPTTDAFGVTNPENAQTKPSFGLSKRRITEITIASVLLGGSALVWGMNKNGGKNIGSSTDSTNVTPVDTLMTDPVAVNPVNNGNIKPNTEIQIAHVNDTLSFEQAFVVARTQVGPGGIFSWHGQVFNTYYKEEWSGLSLSQRQEFLVDVGFQPTINSYVSSVSEEEISSQHQPTYLECTVNGQRVVGIDEDNDGVIDMVVIPQADGTLMTLLDAKGDDSIDTELIFDPISQEVLKIERLENPFIMSNIDFETSMQLLDMKTSQTVLVDDELPIEEKTVEDDFTNDELVDNQDYDNDADIDEVI